MNKRGNFLRISDKSLAIYSIIRLTSYIPITIRRYSRLDDKEQKDNGAKEKQHSQRKEEGHHGQGAAERAPSMAEEFERVAEAKARQGSASQTVEKAEDGSQDATLPDSNFESVEESFKEPPGAGNLHKTGDESRPVKK